MQKRSPRRTAERSAAVPAIASNGQPEPTQAGAAAQSGRSPVARLHRAARTWVESGDATPLLSWLDRALDEDGVPRQLATSDWPTCLTILAQARHDREHRWRVALDARIEAFLRAVLRFARPDGSMVFDTGPPPADRAGMLRTWADQLSDPGLATVLEMWFPSASPARRRRTPPPLPANARTDRPLAMLRADWAPHGDLLAVDHRDRRRACRVELVGLGRRWLGPEWSNGAGVEAATLPRPTLWKTGPYADLAEWTFRAGPARITRTALLLRGRQLALLAEQVAGSDPLASWCIDLAPGVTAAPVPGSRAVTLAQGRGPAARVLPIGLPALDYATERGSFGVENDQLVLRHRQEGRRRWVPLLVSWRAERDRKPVQWRMLTVTERSRICRADEAVAYRVGWGARENLVIYRSLARPAKRAFLGQQTEARFLVGLFSREGVVEPLVSVEDE